MPVISSSLIIQLCFALASGGGSHQTIKPMRIKMFLLTLGRYYNGASSACSATSKFVETRYLNTTLTSELFLKQANKRKSVFSIKSFIAKIQCRLQFWVFLVNVWYFQEKGIKTETQMEKKNNGFITSSSLLLQCLILSGTVIRNLPPAKLQNWNAVKKKSWP